jgi:DNA invertase Pin-like site-specific DNA recombinase
VAEDEARRISERPKAALARAKARGTKLGTSAKVLAEKHRREAMDRARLLSPLINEIRASGITTLRGITEELNVRQIKTPRNGRWHIGSVQRV